MAGAAPVVPGFRASGVRCGIKAREPDLALIASEGPATVAGLFTRSTVVGASVVLSRERVRRGRARAVVANSGIANVGTGARGLRDARAVAACAARALGCRADEVLVASTGLIGVPLPVGRLRKGVSRAALALADDGLVGAARAIMTTDTKPKWAVTRTRVGGRPVTVAGIAKGVGMVEPQLATLLAFLLTDAAVAAPTLRRLLAAACNASFNRITVDGETSTSDTVLLFASGRAGNHPLRNAGRAARPLEDALHAVCERLARALVSDGEGATKRVMVRVRGARTSGDAERAARRIANSALVKTALFGEDPNWGRILQAVGAARVRIDLARSEVRMAGVPLFRAGAPAGSKARRQAAARLRAREVELEVNLGAGRAAATVWTCDLGYDYVRINAEYHT